MAHLLDITIWILLAIPAVVLAFVGFAALCLVILILIIILWTHTWPRSQPFMTIAKGICRCFDLPIGEKLLCFKNIIWNRYNVGPDVQNKDRAIAYAERIIDRQINKARGILPFNSILLVIIGPARNGIAQWSATATATSYFLMKTLWIVTIIDLSLSSILLLEIFTVFWGSIDVYKEWEEEISTSIRLSRNRSVVLDMAILLSALCVISVMIVVFSVPLFVTKS